MIVAFLFLVRVSAFPLFFVLLSGVRRWRSLLVACFVSLRWLLGSLGHRLGDVVLFHFLSLFCECEGRMQRCLVELQR